MCSCALRGIIDEKDPDMVFLLETKLKARDMEAINRKLRYVNKFYMDCEGTGNIKVEVWLCCRSDIFNSILLLHR